MIVLDKYGYPIERVIGRPISNFIRFCLHGSGVMRDSTWTAICLNQKAREMGRDLCRNSVKPQQQE